MIVVTDTGTTGIARVFGSFNRIPIYISTAGRACYIFLETDGFVRSLGRHSEVDVLEGCTVACKNPHWHTREAFVPARIFAPFCAALQSINLRIKTDTSSRTTSKKAKSSQR